MSKLYLVIFEKINQNINIRYIFYTLMTFVQLVIKLVTLETYRLLLNKILERKLN